MSSLGPLANPLSLVGSTSIPPTIAPTTAFTASPLSSSSLASGGGLTQVLGALGQMVSLIANAALAPAATKTAPPQVTTSASGINVPANLNTTTDPLQKDRLDQSLAKVAQDPDGSILLQKAIANGYTIEVGDPNAAGQADLGGLAHDPNICPVCRAALDAGQQLNGITLPDKKKIIINPNAPEFDKTLSHELVHAATENDGNSQQEEGFADVVGYHIASRIDGTPLPGSDADIFNSKIKNYPDLNPANDILNSLRNLGN